MSAIDWGPTGAPNNCHLVFDSASAKWIAVRVDQHGSSLVDMKRHRSDAARVARLRAIADEDA